MDGQSDDDGTSDGTVRVCYLDDDANELAAVATHVERERNGFEVVTASDGARAVELVDDDGIDCIVADVGVPGVEDGVLLSGHDLPVVLYTDADPEMIDESVLAATDTLVQKGNGEQSRAFLFEKVDSLTTDREDRGRAAIQRALDRIERGVHLDTSLFLLYVDGTIVWQTDPFEDVFPVDAVDATVPDSMDFYERLTALLADDPETIQAIRQPDDQPQPHSLTVPLPDGDVHFRYVEYQIPEEIAPMRLLVVEDVTDSVRQSARTERLERVIERAPDGMYTVDAEGIVDFCTETFATTLGYEREEIIGKHASDLMADGELERGHRRIESVLERPGDDSTTIEMTLVDSDGNPVELSISFTVLYENDTYAGMVGVARDVTDRHSDGQSGEGPSRSASWERHREELELLKEVLARVLRHNIRSELTVIKSHAEMLAEQLDGQQREMAETIVERGDALVETSEKARGVERVLEGSNDCVVQSLADAVDVASSSVETEYPDAAYDVDVPDVDVDAHPALATAIENTIENAVEHNDGDRPTVTVTADVTSEMVCLSVSDDGPGIPEPELDVLDRAEETPMAHGSGLGLWLIEWVVDRSGGALSFHTDEYGTTVDIRLERADADGTQ